MASTPDDVPMNRLLLALISGAVFVAFGASACGGGGGDGTGADEERLAELREEVLYLFDATEAEALLIEALDIAERNSGTPLGDEAFAFVEEVYVEDWLYLDTWPFSDRAPDLPLELMDTDADSLRRLVGFLEVVPPGYEATRVTARLHQDLMDHGDFRLTDLEWAQTAREEWAMKLASEGVVEGSWFVLTLRLADGTSGSMGSKSSEEYLEDLVELRYMRELAVAAGEPAEFLAAWDELIAGYELGSFAPPQSDSTYEDGTFVTYYSEEAVTEGAANAEALAASIAICREYFPETED
jgi:hypothetical protein